MTFIMDSQGEQIMDDIPMNTFVFVLRLFVFSLLFSLMCICLLFFLSYVWHLLCICESGCEGGGQGKREDGGIGGRMETKKAVIRRLFFVVSYVLGNDKKKYILSCFTLDL